MGYLSCNADSAISTCDSYTFDFKSKQKHFKIKHYSYSDLHNSTNGFSQSNFLGKGSHGSVYKAALNNGKLIAAVKKTTVTSHHSSTNCTNSPAENEIEILSRVRSPRLVNLLGFAVDSGERRLIVVEFMPNGTLYDALHGKATRPPGWTRRLRFAIQVAKAVQHLHSSNPPVIHRDIKSSNVLIDGNRNARLGDFGLALRGNVEDVRVKCTPPAGTLGYLDPGYLAPGDLSAKSDVFSFGILLLEIISGRNAIDMNYSPSSVVDWAAPLIRSGDCIKICDPRIGKLENEAAMRQLAVLAAKCVRSTAEKRPTMAEVVECLRVLQKRVASPMWNNMGRRVGRTTGLVVIKYETLDESSEIVKRGGSRRNRKVSSVPSVELEGDAIGCGSDIRLGRSKSIGSTNEINFGPLDLNSGRKKAGLAVKMATVRLRKSRSTGVLLGRRLVDHNNGNGLVKNPNGRELEESKLLINNLGKELKEGN